MLHSSPIIAISNVFHEVSIQVPLGLFHGETEWSMIYSLIQIGPETLNNMTNITYAPTSVGYDILQRALTLVIGLLIIFTLKRLDFTILTPIRGTNDFRPHRVLTTWQVALGNRLYCEISE